MNKKQFEELLKALKGIEAALLALRVPNIVYVSQGPTSCIFPTYPIITTGAQNNVPNSR